MAGYLEMHVEQGVELERRAVPIWRDGANRRHCLLSPEFSGSSGSCGSTAINERRDAALGASDFILALHNLLLEQFPDCFANVGDARFSPAAFNIVPKKVTLAVEFRAAARERFELLKAAALRLAKDSAERYRLGLETEFIGKHNEYGRSTGTSGGSGSRGAARPAHDRLDHSHWSRCAGARHPMPGRHDLRPFSSR